MNNEQKESVIDIYFDECVQPYNDMPHELLNVDYICTKLLEKLMQFTQKLGWGFEIKVEHNGEDLFLLHMEPEEEKEKPVVEVQYPELEKVKEAHVDSAKITEFVEWLHGKDIELCQFKEKHHVTYYPVQQDMEEMLADYFEIDLKQVEKERRALLESINA